MADQRKKGETTELLIHKEWDKLMPRVYDELLQIARLRLTKLRPGDTLDTRALVHEAYLKLVDMTRVDWQERAHFYAVASQAMRYILVNYAIKRSAKKRGGDAVKKTLDSTGQIPVEEIATGVIDIDNALKRLAELDERQSLIVECRFFGGLTVEETAEALSISSATVKRDWRKARAWLFGELKDQA